MKRFGASLSDAVLYSVIYLSIYNLVANDYCYYVEQNAVVVVADTLLMVVDNGGLYLEWDVAVAVVPPCSRTFPVRVSRKDVNC